MGEANRGPERDRLREKVGELRRQTSRGPSPSFRLYTSMATNRRLMVAMASSDSHGEPPPSPPPLLQYARGSEAGGVGAGGSSGSRNSASQGYGHPVALFQAGRRGDVSSSAVPVAAAPPPPVLAAPPPPPSGQRKQDRPGGISAAGGVASSPTASPSPNQRCSSPSPRGEKGKYMVMGVLSSALDLAKAAVAHDEQGALPEKVLPYYKKAIRAIDTALKLLPEHVAESTGIKRHRDNYQARVDKLTQGLSRDNQQKDRRARQQSRVRFSQMDLDAKQSTLEDEPTNPTRRSYWVLRLVRTTILCGGYLTPRLYVPKEVWAQVGVKVAGFAPRITALDSVIYMIIDKIKYLPKPVNAEARKEAAQVMRAFRLQAHKLQTDLSRQFPYVVPVDPLVLAKVELGPKSNIGRLNSAMKNIGRNVKNSAAVAVGRIGAGIQGKHVDDGLPYYKQAVAELCEECQVFDSWFSHLQDQMAKNDTEEMDDLLVELHLVGSFMREVVCAMVLRDLEGLVDRYLRKMRKSFARMYWDEDYEDYEEEDDVNNANTATNIGGP
ncbi:unnamed protein product [Scytosiphon promiscuus]